jgi:hypothetical protein
MHQHSFVHHDHTHTAPFHPQRVNSPVTEVNFEAVTNSPLRRATIPHGRPFHEASSIKAYPPTESVRFKSLHHSCHQAELVQICISLHPPIGNIPSQDQLPPLPSSTIPSVPLIRPFSSSPPSFSPPPSSSILRVTITTGLENTPAAADVAIKSGRE